MVEIDRRLVLISLKLFQLITVLLILLLIPSCAQQGSGLNQDSGPDNETNETSLPSSSTVTLMSITITPESPQPLPAGSVQEFEAIGIYSDGTTENISSQVTWHSSNLSVASMYPYGGAFAKSEGNTQITATLDDIISSAVTLSVPPNDTLLLIYLDSNYTILWDEENQPDLDTLIWEPAPDVGSPYEWEQSILTVYLWNTGNVTLEVSAGNNLRAMAPGFSVDSEVVIVRPGERIPLDIIVKQSIEVIGFTGNSSFSVWFDIRETN